MKVVFDTNIPVLALVFPGGRADIALRRIIEERDQLLLSKPILECAVTGGADAIVTGDKALLELKNFRKVKLLSLRAYFEEVL